MDIESCPLCYALPCDWVDNPHKAQDALFMALADLRIKCGCGEKPMLSELPGVIAAEITRLRAELERVREAGRQVVEEWDMPFDFFEELAATMEGPITALRTALEGEEGK